MNNAAAQTGKLTRHHLIGLGFWQAWQMAAFCSNSVIADASSAGLSLKTLVIACTTLGYLVVMAASEMRRARPERPADLIGAAAAMAVGSLVMMFVPALSDAGLETIALVFSLATISFGNAALLIMWGELWGTLATGRVGRHLYLSYAFAFVLFFCVFALPRPLDGLLACTFPLLSAAILKSCANEPRRMPLRTASPISKASVVRALAFIAILSMVWGISQNIVPSVAADAASGDFMGMTMLVAGIAIGAFALNLVLSAPPSETAALYRPVIPAMAAGLMALVALPPSFAFIGNGLIAMGIYCLDMFLMLASTDLAFRCKIPTVFAFGIAVFTSRIGTLAGSIASTALASWMTADESFPIVAALCLGALAVTGTLVFTQADLQQCYETPRAHLQNETPTLSQRCAALAESARLTARETEVLSLLVRGRTVQDVCEELVIAQGTAKHHVSNIYRKLGVGDRRSLYDAVEQAGETS